jgi:HEAT repeat protein
MKSKAFATGLLVALGIALVSAVLVPPRDIGRLVEQSTLVAIGTVLGVSTPLERVAFSVAAVIDSPEASASDRESLMLDGDALRTPEMRAALRRALGDSDPSLRFTAAACLLRLGDLSGVAEIEKVLLHGGSSLREQDLGRARAVLAKVADPAAIPTLTRLLESSGRQTRGAAAMALRSIRSPLSIPALVRALDDSDQEVQYHAVMTLAELAKDYDHAPSMDRFRERPGEYVQYWRTWAAKREVAR